MRVLIGCECSGVLRQAFEGRGHYTISVDMKPAEDGAWANYGKGVGAHHQQDILSFLFGHDRHHEVKTGFDLFVGMPECRYLCNSGVKWLYKDGQKKNGKDPQRWRDMRKAAQFFNILYRVPIDRIALENSVMHEYAINLTGGLDFFVQPWWFGSPRLKATGFKVKNLPPLKATNKIIPPRDPKERARWAIVHRESPGPERSTKRARTDPGIAAAIAEQWGSL